MTAPPNDVLALGHFCEKHGPSVVFVCEAVTARHVPQQAPPSSASAPALSACAMCRSLGDGAMLVSSDGGADASTQFVSRRFPDEPTAYARVRTACVRALSCEICPGREGPILFGDDDCTSLAYAFRLRDSEARGFARWYSLILLSCDAYHLAACHATLAHHMRAIVRQLKQRAMARFNTTSNNTNSSSNTNNSSSNSSGGGGGSSTSSKSSTSSTVSMTPGYRSREIGSAKLRSLVELTECPTLFSELHAQFAWILKAYRTHFVVNVPPLIDLRVFPRPLTKAADATALTLSALFDAVGDGDDIVLFSVLSGRRVLVRYDDGESARAASDQSLAIQICRLLTRFLPDEVAWPVACLTSVDEPLDGVPASTKFVVLPRGFAIPAELSASSFVLLDVLQCEPLHIACSGPTRGSWLCAAMRETLARRAQLNDAALLRLVDFTKAQWRAKCELYVAFVKANHDARGVVDADKVDRFLSVVALSGKDLSFLTRWCVDMK